MSKYNKKYLTEEEKMSKYNIFRSNIIYISEHNQRESSFRMGINQFGDIKRRELNDMTQSGKKLNQVENRNRSLEEVNIDWTKRGKVTKVIHEGSTGAAEAYSVVGSVESLHAIVKGNLVEYSVIEAVSAPLGEVTSLNRYINLLRKRALPLQIIMCLANVGKILPSK